jgi:hypothetical protein
MNSQNHAGDAMARARAAIYRMKEQICEDADPHRWTRIASLLRLAADAADAAAKDATEE